MCVFVFIFVSIRSSLFFFSRHDDNKKSGWEGKHTALLMSLWGNDFKLQVVHAYNTRIATSGAARAAWPQINCSPRTQNLEEEGEEKNLLS